MHKRRQRQRQWQLIGIISIFSLMVSCASGPVDTIRTSEVNITGGKHKINTWDDTLEFKRTSWYLGSSLAYDVLITKLDKSSPFSYWLENSQKGYAQECKTFYVALFYSNTMSSMYDIESTATIKNQITDLGFDEVSLSQFRAYLSSHIVFNQWHLRNHKIAGFCYKKSDMAPELMPVSLPGFNTQDLLKKR